MIQPLFLTSMS